MTNQERKEIVDRAAAATIAEYGDRAVEAVEGRMRAAFAQSVFGNPFYAAVRSAIVEIQSNTET
ncbi:hypothetical protein [Listeria monocytogenes]|uniref:hypothetical protein n=1 Tax=Listeria monocytogenes TaxID=1639 RepID=UPI002FDBBF31